MILSIDSKVKIEGNILENLLEFAGIIQGMHESVLKHSDEGLAREYVALACRLAYSGVGNGDLTHFEEMSEEIDDVLGRIVNFK